MHSRHLSLLFALACGCTSAPSAKETPGIFVLGVDGMDPVILQRMVDEGELPAFAQLIEDGGFQDLGTSWPPQSPVAWSNFVTGMNPGGHGIYDFIHRDPLTYAPLSSATPPSSGEQPMTVEVGEYIIPLGGEDAVNNRSGEPFWDLLHAAGVDTEIYRIPANYPVPESEAKVLSGMGTVDMRGEFGTYTFYTSEPLWDADIKGDIEVVRLVDTDLDGHRDQVRSRLKGPPDIFRLQPGQIPGSDDYLSVPLLVSIDAENDVAWIRAGSGDAVLQPGEWSDWVELSFDDALPGGLMPLSGTVRFYLKSIGEPFQLYASPVNINPVSPAQPITSPDDFVEELADELGPFYTQGMPEETNALKDKVFDDDDYVSQVELVHQDTKAMLDMALGRFESGGMSFVYLSEVDLQCHMLWRYGDPKHEGEHEHPALRPEYWELQNQIEQNRPKPRGTPAQIENAKKKIAALKGELVQLRGLADVNLESADRLVEAEKELQVAQDDLAYFSKLGPSGDFDQLVAEQEAIQTVHEEMSASHVDDIEDYYRSVDAMLASTRAELPEDTLLMVMSDHGFQPYTRKFHLNDWLVEEGYLVLNEDWQSSAAFEGGASAKIGSDAIDWSKSVAYGLGFNGLYLNLEGREGQGIVSPDEAEALKQEIGEKLEALTDGEHNGRRVILEVVSSDEVYSGVRLSEAPDLLIGYDRHYGASDESTLGEILSPPDGTSALVDNTDRWSGNHLMSPSVVPGVLLLNQPFNEGDYNLTDLTVTLLDYYGLSAGEGMVGQSILKN